MFEILSVQSRFFKIHNISRNSFKFYQKSRLLHEIYTLKILHNDLDVFCFISSNIVIIRHKSYFFLVVYCFRFEFKICDEYLKFITSINVTFRQNDNNRAITRVFFIVYVQFDRSLSFR